MRRLRTLSICVAVAGSPLLACEEAPTPKPNRPTPGETPVSWAPGAAQGQCNVDALLSPQSYGAKIKSLLTGLPLTEPELATLNADPAALSGMIDAWLETPEAAAMLQRFFMTAFQQTETSNASLFYMLGRKAQFFGSYPQTDSAPKSETAGEMLNRNFAESFARTAVDIVQSGRPFSDVLTTDEFMMTTAQMSFMAFVDDEVIDDAQGHTVRTTLHDFDTITLVKKQADAPPPSEALDPTSPSFGTFWHYELADLPAECNVVASQVVDTTQVVEGQWRLGDAVTPSFYVYATMMGRHFNVQIAGNQQCKTGATSKGTPLFDRGDFSDWRRVKIRKPAGSERPTLFYNLGALRAASEMALHTERSGFLTSPGFFSTWMNNEDNSARVTTNQALIVALGKSFEGQAVTDFSPASLDAEHASPDSECYGCHQTLDPMRDFYRASFSNFYGQQLDPDRTQLEADFVFDGEKAAGTGVRAFASILAEHPSFPAAWAHKLCFLANSAPCVEGDALDAVVAAFQASDLDFRVLVRELFSSPLVTGAECVSGTNAGSDVSIARRSLFCGELSHRLQVDDICGLATSVPDGDELQNAVRDAAGSIPDDGFSRAVVAPVVISETGLFTRANTEAACVLVAQNGYDVTFAGLGADEATRRMVVEVMGLSAEDTRHQASLDLLREHVATAIEQGTPEQDAVKSAFVLACLAPSVAGVGF